MNYLDILLMIAERQENILNQDSSTLITNAHRYLRQSGDWIEDPNPGVPVEKYTRAGKVWAWNKTEQTNETG